MLLLTETVSPVTMDQIEGPETRSKRRLIAAGERLLGERGFNGLSLQDIASAAGNANKYAVQYHFGSKEGLIDAILALRLRWIDRRRTVLFEEAGKRDLLSSVPALLEILYLPVAEQVDDSGRHSFARFRLQYYTRPDYDRASDDVQTALHGPLPEVRRRLIAGAKLDAEEVQERLHLLGSLTLAALVDRDNSMAHGRSTPSLELVIARTTQIAAHAILAA